jgi:hypothetical protein
MPWTRKQFAYLMSSGSPLTPTQKAKDKAEAHADPSLIHKTKSALKMARERVHGRR